MDVTFRRDESVGVRAAVVADGDANTPSRGHVAFLVVLTSFRRHLPEDLFSEAHETLAKRSATGSCPRGQPVLASDAGVGEKRRVLQQPAAEWVKDWQSTAGPRLDAQPQRTEEPADSSDTNLHTTTGLAVILLVVFHTDNLQRLHFALENLERSRATFPDRS